MSGNIAFVNGGQTDEQGLARHILKFFSAGVMGTGDLAVTQRGAGANNTVDVAVGDILIDSGLGYPYHGWITATENVGSITADATNPRNVIIVVYKDNSVVSNASANNPGALKFLAVLGTPAATPADPSDATIQSTVGSGNKWAKLARIALPAGGGTPTITNAMITDLRSFSSFALANAVGVSNIKSGFTTGKNINFLTSSTSYTYSTNAFAVIGTFSDTFTFSGGPFTVDMFVSRATNAGGNYYFGLQIGGSSLQVTPTTSGSGYPLMGSHFYPAGTVSGSQTIKPGWTAQNGQTITLPTFEQIIITITDWGK